MRSSPISRAPIDPPAGRTSANDGACRESNALEGAPMTAALQPPEARKVALIGVACGLGGADARCADAPAALLAAGLAERLRARGLDCEKGPVLAPDGSGSARRQVSRLCARLAAEVGAALRAGRTPCVIGGDHACAAGTWSGAAHALAARGPLGLIWIDAHLDSHTPRTSPSGRLHGMPLAALLGEGDDARRELGPGPLAARHVCVVGVRSFEREECRLLERLGVRMFFMEEIWQRGLDAVMADALAIATEGTAGFGITLDLDALDPVEAPAVATPAPGGLRARPLAAALAAAARDPRLAAFELVEFCPPCDRAGRTARLAVELTSAALAGAYDPPASAAAAEAAYGARNYDPLPIVLVRGQGVWLWDEEGRRYLDMMASYSAVSHGHAHPRLLAALEAQARALAVSSRAFHNDRLPQFLARLCELTGMDRALPANTGLEAVEAALKAARKWAYEVKGVPEGAAEIIACEGNFHGRSIAILGMSTEPQYRRGFGPFPPGFRTVPYGDAAALERAITPHTAAFLVEPIQGERGIVLPPDGYLAECARICRSRNVLFIADEVQTGLGRTGRLLACEHEGVKPDGLVLGKALGGGLLPVSAFLAREDVMRVFRPGDHGSTFGGNALASAVALEALEVLVEERLAERAAVLGPVLLAGLRAIRSPLVREVRGRGLLAGVQLDTRLVPARRVVERLAAHGVLTFDAHGSVIRFSPPLVITHEELAWALERIRAGFEELDREARRAA
jgi:ornithine--oxo-acid transaminase